MYDSNILKSRRNNNYQQQQSVPSFPSPNQTASMSNGYVLNNQSCDGLSFYTGVWEFIPSNNATATGLSTYSLPSNVSYNAYNTTETWDAMESCCNKTLQKLEGDCVIWCELDFAEDTYPSSFLRCLQEEPHDAGAGAHAVHNATDASAGNMMAGRPNLVGMGMAMIVSSMLFTL
ncbi:hypothetical protein GGR57DRAFT_456998 [Xylariaceae sp. FL1272]|nr:hypothetical protein GGR57DRAFT_456998 [Xylariaceae sp. FL1272]